MRLNGTVTSTIANFPVSHDVVRRVNDRIAELSGLPTHWSEPLRGLHYSPGAYFRGHLDSHQHTHQRTSTRVATCLLYLNDVGDGDGGETHFPFAVSATGVGESAPPACRGFESKDPSVQSAEALDAYEDGSELHSVQELLGEPRGALGVTVRPRKGRAVLWWNRDADGALALRSRHVGCPLLRGTKVVATRWMHSQCEDAPLPLGADWRCREWVASGECASNRVFMETSCKRSCGLCPPDPT